MIMLTGGGECAWSQGDVPGPGGVPGPRGSALGGVVPGGDPPPGTGTAAGGTHPTGMQSCLQKVFKHVWIFHPRTHQI